jgi:phosphate transport system substrate-binding protein
LNSGDADEDGDGKVTPQELFNYLSRRLEREYDHQHRPLIVEERSQASIAIAMSPKVDARRAIPADIESMLADPTRLSAGLRKLLDYDERQAGRNRPLVVEKLTSLLHKETDVMAGEEIVQPGCRTQRSRRRVLVTLSVVAVAVLAGATATAMQLTKKDSNDIRPAVAVAGEITIAGSSTVEPVVRRAADEFHGRQPNAHIGISAGGTGSGFHAFCTQQSVTDGIDLVDASRPITVAEEATCEKNDIKYERFHLGYDGLSVVVSKENRFLEHLTFEELGAVFSRSNMQSWQQIDPSFPKEPIKICAPGPNSGTFDFFVGKVLSGDADAFRNDLNVTRSEVDNELVQCVQSNPFSIGFFGHSFYSENTSRLKALAIAEKLGQNPELPTEDEVLTNLYPLARPLFVYAREESISTKPQVAEFLRFLFGNAERVVRQVGYFPAYGKVYSDNLAKVDKLG